MFNTKLSATNLTATFGKIVTRTRRSVGMFLAVALLMATAAIPAYPQSPSATLKMIDPQSGYQYGTVEIFTTNTNAFGFWARVWMSGATKLRTAVPYKSNPDGSISMWFIEYSYYQGAPLDTKYWVETYSGQVSLTMSTATPTSVDGFMIITAQKVGYTRVDYRDTWHAIRLTT